MSLWCGSCRNEIFDGFGILYKLERTIEGKLLYPDKTMDYVPPNSAVCDRCWSNVPKSKKHSGEQAKSNAEQSKETVFAYAPADSSNDAFWKSKTWSGIVTEDDKLVFIAPDAVNRFFINAVKIIDNMADRRARAREGVN